MSATSITTLIRNTLCGFDGTYTANQISGIRLFNKYNLMSKDDMDAVLAKINNSSVKTGEKIVICNNEDDTSDRVVSENDVDNSSAVGKSTTVEKDTKNIDKCPYPLPFISVDNTKCYGVCYAGALYLQCSRKPIKPSDTQDIVERDGMYCKTCQKSADKVDGKPKCGNIFDRMKCITSGYKTRDGKRAWSYKAILEWKKYDPDVVISELKDKYNIEIPQEILDDDWQTKAWKNAKKANKKSKKKQKKSESGPKKRRGRPKKNNDVAIPTQEESDKGYGSNNQTFIYSDDESEFGDHADANDMVEVDWTDKIVGDKDINGITYQLSEHKQLYHDNEVVGLMGDDGTAQFKSGYEPCIRPTTPGFTESQEGELDDDDE